MINKDIVRQALVDAADLANDVPEPYRVEAFRAVSKVLLPRMPQATADAGPESVSVEKKANGRGPHVAVNERLAAVRGCSHTDKFKVIIFHALDSEGLEALTMEEIFAAYTAARMPKPTNPSDIIAKCSSRGHVTEGQRRDGQKTWRLTGSGERYVRELLEEQTQRGRANDRDG